MSNIPSVAVIGGTGGIGGEIVLEFARHHWRVLLTYKGSRSEARRLQNQADQFGAGALSVRLNLNSTRGIQPFLKALARFAPMLNAVVFSQGVLRGKSLSDQSLRDMQRSVAVNLVGTMHLTKLLLPRLARGASVTFVSSISAFAGSYDPVYAATKGALVSFSKSIARNHGPAVRSNVVAPGLIARTRMATEMRPRTRSAHVAKTALGRLGSPLDVARAVYYLSAETGRHVTGATLDVNGGEYFR